MTKQMNKALHTDIAARSDFWEAGFFIDASKARERRTAKRTAKRATRRLGKLECREAV